MSYAAQRLEKREIIRGRVRNVLRMRNQEISVKLKQRQPRSVPRAAAAARRE